MITGRVKRAQREAGFKYTDGTQKLNDAVRSKNKVDRDERVCFVLARV